MQTERQINNCHLRELRCEAGSCLVREHDSHITGIPKTTAVKHSSRFW